MSRYLCVLLDHASYGAGPGKVISVHEDMCRALRAHSDRDGCRNRRIRVWEGDAAVGDVVRARHMGCPECDAPVGHYAGCATFEDCERE